MSFNSHLEGYDDFFKSMRFLCFAHAVLHVDCVGKDCRNRSASLSILSIRRMSECMCQRMKPCAYLPVHIAASRHPVVEDARLQVVHHRLIAPNPVTKAHCSPVHT